VGRGNLGGTIGGQFRDISYESVHYAVQGWVWKGKKRGGPVEKLAGGSDVQEKGPNSNPGFCPSGGMGTERRGGSLA